MLIEACCRYGSSTGLCPCMQGPTVDCKQRSTQSATWLEMTTALIMASAFQWLLQCALLPSKH